MSAFQTLRADDIPAPSAALRIRGVTRPRRLPEDLRQPVALDRRTKLGKAAEAFRAELIAHVGGQPSAVQSALIEQAVQLRLRLLAQDAAFIESGGQPAPDCGQYASWSNSFSRALELLGLVAAVLPSSATSTPRPAAPGATTWCQP